MYELNVFCQEFGDVQPGPQGALTTKYEKKKTMSDHPKMQSVEESNALRNWQLRMMERKKQQGYLSSKSS